MSVSQPHLNTFAVLILKKGKESENPRYEYYHEKENLVNEDRAVQILNSIYSDYPRYSSYENSNSGETLYWVKIDEDNKPVIKKMTSIISDEDIESQMLLRTI